MDDAFRKVRRLLFFGGLAGAFGFWKIEGVLEFEIVPGWQFAHAEPTTRVRAPVALAFNARAPPWSALSSPPAATPTATRSNPAPTAAPLPLNSYHTPAAS